MSQPANQPAEAQPTNPGGFVAPPTPNVDATVAGGTPGQPRTEAAETPGDLSQHETPSIPTLDRYRLIEVIGEGGMGTVWRAEQTEPVVRDVAIKMIHTDLASPELVSRFLAERQTLARMSHPDISNILDGGTTSSGQPYLVMELATGCQLDEFCERHRLSIHARVQLVARIAKALQHAHDRGVIHRDLKPANLLADGTPQDPTLKVIDFGISKVLSESDSHCDPAARAGMTLAGEIVGTPHFMSPEQANLDHVAIDARSDIYALGVVLYLLVTEVPPLAAAGIAKDRPLTELLHAVLHTDPPRPSVYLKRHEELERLATARSTTKHYLRRQTQGDLDWIILKALAKDPAQRYSTAAALLRI